MPVTSTYLLDYVPVEAERLLFMAQLLAPEVRATCERAGLSAGGRAIDVCCGPIGSLVALQEVVGPSGAVVGVDADPVALRSAAAVLEQLSISNVRLVEADINSAGPDEIGPAAGYDLAFVRLALMHQADPAATLTRIGELLRPGGTVVAFDLLRPPAVAPEWPEFDRAWAVILEGMRLKGAHPETSTIYPRLAAAAGLEVVSQRGVFFPIPPAAAVGETTALLRAARSSLANLGVADADDIEQMVAGLEAGQGDLTFATTPFAVELIARRPA